MPLGTLYIVATPIGNLEDITFRAVRVLKEADLIAAEDTRHSRKLLSHFGISRPLTSYFDHNKDFKGKYLLEKLEEGQEEEGRHVVGDLVDVAGGGKTTA